MSKIKTSKKVESKSEFEILMENVLGQGFNASGLEAPVDDVEVDAEVEAPADENLDTEGDTVTLSIPRHLLTELKALIDAAVGEEGEADDQFGEDEFGEQGDADFDIEDENADPVDEDNEEEVTDEDNEEPVDEDNEEEVEDDKVMKESTAAKKLPEKKAITTFKNPKVKGKLSTTTTGKAKTEKGKKSDGKLEKAPAAPEKKFKSGKVEGRASRVGKTLFDK